MDTLWARWSQAKRHALGVSELVYFSSTMPSLVWDRASFGLMRRLHLLVAGIVMFLKMSLIHTAMANVFIMGPMNGIVITYFYRHNLIDDVTSFTFLANLCFQFFSATTFIVYLYTNVLLYDIVADRIRGYEDRPTRRFYRSHFCHFMTLLFTCTPVMPIMYVMGGISEVLAAIKTAFTHKFDYEVALKAAPVPTSQQIEMTRVGNGNV